MNQSFATEEKGSIAHIENAQPAIGTLPFANRLAGAGSRFHATNPADQPAEGIRFIERVAQFDPCRGSQKRGQAAAFGSLCTWQEDGNHAETPAAIEYAPIDSRTHFFVLPGAESAATDENRAGFGFRKGLFNRWLPRIARNQMPFVQPPPL